MPNDFSISVFAASNSIFNPLSTSLVISCPQKHTLHLSTGCGSILLMESLALRSGVIETEFAKFIFTLLSPSSKPQRQAGVQGERAVPFTQTLVEPIIL